ncbi:hypothetical protein DdX_00606 [Ditylenchus destructor]|uniref:Uncharacterized protein n=1 Tax=Ditylenchus destructor TaxID=166010 RepID=A0AAD4NE16_9BILA|nr:hypothetical protein DdX_00606 [Ditylenchus destructor]
MCGKVGWVDGCSDDEQLDGSPLYTPTTAGSNLPGQPRQVEKGPRNVKNKDEKEYSWGDKNSRRRTAGRNSSNPSILLPIALLRKKSQKRTPPSAREKKKNEPGVAGYGQKSRHLLSSTSGLEINEGQLRWVDLLRMCVVPVAFPPLSFIFLSQDSLTYRQLLPLEPTSGGKVHFLFDVNIDRHK